MAIIEVEAPIKKAPEEIQVPEKRPEKLETKILRRASEILRTIGWTQYAFARNKKGEEIENYDRDYLQAGSYCMWGAIYRAEGELRPNFKVSIYDPKTTLFQGAVWSGSINASWNDEVDRTVEEVTSALDDLADRVELGLI